MKSRRFCMSVSVVALIVLAISCAAVYADDIYVMDSENSANMDSIVGALTNRGHDVIVGLPWYRQDGAQSLSNYSAVVFTNSYNWDSGSMPESGQTEIVNYVSNGGGLVTGEWFVWDAYYDYFPAIKPLSPVQLTNQYNSGAATVYSQVTPDATINNGLPTSFGFTLDNVDGTESVFMPQSGATMFYSSSNGGGVQDSGGLVGWDYGLGKVISFSTVIGSLEMSDPNYAKLFCNSVDWARGTVVPEPASMLLFGLGGGVLALVRRKKRT